MTILKPIWNKVQLTLNLFRFYFWLVYHKEIFKSINNHSYQSNYQRESELEKSTIDNIFAIQKMSYLAVTLVTSQLMTSTEKKTSQVLVVVIIE